MRIHTKILIKAFDKILHKNNTNTSYKVITKIVNKTRINMGFKTNIKDMGETFPIFITNFR